jgi:ATP-binding cassette subfamily B protein
MAKASAAAAEPAEQPILSLESDLTEDRKFGLRTLELYTDRVEVRGEAGARILRADLEDLSGVRCDSLVSGGRIVLQLKSGGEILAVNYSQTTSKYFADAAGAIEQAIEGEEIVPGETPGRLSCPKCGKLLPERDGICPGCVSRGKTMLRIGKFLAPYKSRALLLVVAAASTTALNLAPPWIQGSIIKEFSEGGSQLNTLFGLMGIWAVVLLCQVGLQILNGRLMTHLATHISADLRSAVYRAIEFLQISYFDRKPVGAIASRVTQDTDRVWHFLVDGLPFFIVNGLMLVGVAVLLFTMNWVLALCILAPFPLVMMVSMIVWKPISNMFHRVSQKMARVHMQLGESLMGIRVVKVFAREDHEYERFMKRNNELRDAATQADQSWHTAYGAMTLFTSLGVVTTWTVGGAMLYQGQLQLDEFWRINAYVLMIYGPLQWFAQVNNWFTRAMAGAERIFEILDMTPETAVTKGVNRKIEGRVEFQDVRFGYEKSNPVLRHVSFDVAPGEMIGLVGHSGAGKSTIINLLTRFYEVDSGAILVDGVEIRDYDLQDFRAQIGIVLQEPFLFHGTIAENIRYGKPDATFEEVMAAAQAANAHDFVLAKPEGYDTVVGERGARLSGGEKQRISIARAILHDPRILIFDEATSSVDVETEREIQEAIQNLVSGRTTFAIAHRLSTLRNANRLFVMDRGKIVEEGTHEELIAQRGAFAKLVETQSKVNEVIGIGA